MLGRTMFARELAWRFGHKQESLLVDTAIAQVGTMSLLKTLIQGRRVHFVLESNSLMSPIDSCELIRGAGHFKKSVPERFFMKVISLVHLE
jgi:hypothetical protein